MLNVASVETFPMTKTRSWMFAVAASAALVLVMSDAEAQGRGQGRGRRGPPAIAYDACANKKVGAACEFDCPRRGHVSGTCQFWRGDQLSCVSNDRPPRGRGGR